MKGKTEEFYVYVSIAGFRGDIFGSDRKEDDAAGVMWIGPERGRRLYASKIKRPESPNYKFVWHGEARAKMGHSAVEDAFNIAKKLV
jgi:hypothetical protein